jgi:hypothetical protein
MYRKIVLYLVYRNPFPKGTRVVHTSTILVPDHYCIFYFLTPCIALVFLTKSMMKADYNIVSMHIAVTTCGYCSYYHLLYSYHHHHITTSSSIDQHYCHRHLCLHHCCELLNEMFPTVEVNQMDQHIYLME